MQLIKNFRRYCRFKAIDFVLSLKRDSRAINLEDVKSIVFIRWDGKLGDSVIASLFLKAIRTHRPDIEVTVITNSLAKVWMEKVVDANYLEMEKRNSAIKEQLAPLKGKFDVAIEMSTKVNNRNLFALGALDAKVNISYGKEAFRLFDINVKEKNFVERYRELTGLFVKRKVAFPIPIPDFSEAVSMNSFCSLKKIIAVNFWSSVWERSFSQSAAIELVNTLAEEMPDFDIVLVPVPGKQEFLREVNEQSLSNVVLPEVNPSIENTLMLLQHSELVITPDTSVVHMASALDRKILAIYSNDISSFEEWRPHSSVYDVEFVCAKKQVDIELELTDFDFGALIDKARRLALT